MATSTCENLKTIGIIFWGIFVMLKFGQSPDLNPIKHLIFLPAHLLLAVLTKTGRRQVAFPVRAVQDCARVGNTRAIQALSRRDRSTVAQ